MTRESWIDRNVRTVAEMVSNCPAFWDICGIDSADPVAAQKAARLRTKEGSLQYFNAETDANDPGVEEADKLKPRERRTRKDWIDARPLATVMHDTEMYGIETKAVGVFLPSGLITVVVEKNVLGPDGQPWGDADMPSEAAANQWISQVANLQEELHQISNQNRLPETNIAYPGEYLWITRTALGIVPQFGTLVMNQIYGPHFLASIEISYGPKN